MRSLLPWSRDFPEFHQMISCFDKAILAGDKSLEYFDQAHAEPFILFASRLPGKISDNVQTINDVIIKERPHETSLIHSLSQIKTELTKIKVLEENNRTEHTRFNKFSEEYERTGVQIEELRAKAASGGTPKQANQLQELERKREMMEEEIKKRADSLEEADKKYVERLKEAIVAALKGFAVGRLEHTNSLQQLGEEIQRLGDDIPSVADPSIQVLENELSALESIEVC